jgi:hypothetical protein
MAAITLIKGKTFLHLSEGSYPLNYAQGITIFWQEKNAPEGRRGVLDIKQGINYVPWVKFETPANNLYVPETCIEDGWNRYYLPRVPDILSATQKLKGVIEDKRRKYGFRISKREIEDMVKQGFIVNCLDAINKESLK